MKDSVGDSNLGLALIAVISLCAVQAIDVAYLDKHCGSSIKVHDAIQLKLTGTLSYQPNMNCSTRFYNDKMRKMLGKFISVKIEHSNYCRRDRVELYNNSVAQGKPIAVVCGFIVPLSVFDSSGDNFVVRFLSDNDNVFQGFELIITPYYTGNCDDDSFPCRNKRCVAGSLACDGFNNCGDDSDEVDGCALSSGLLAAIILLSVAVFCLLVFSLYVFMHRKCGSNNYGRLL